MPDDWYPSGMNDVDGEWLTSGGPRLILGEDDYGDLRGPRSAAERFAAVARSVEALEPAASLLRLEQRPPPFRRNGGVPVMPDALSPAEQARAARWAADWLINAGFNTGAGVFVVRALFDRADTLAPPAPPETVASLRAERDAEHDAWQSAENALHAAVDELRAAEADVAYWREQFCLVCDESKDRETEIARLRATHAEQIEDMKARWLKDARERSTDLFLAKNPLPSSDAARGRCSRED